MAAATADRDARGRMADGGGEGELSGNCSARNQLSVVKAAIRETRHSPRSFPLPRTDVELLSERKDVCVLLPLSVTEREREREREQAGGGRASREQESGSRRSTGAYEETARRYHARIDDIASRLRLFPYL
jgi:hypothetical protein